MEGDRVLRCRIRIEFSLLATTRDALSTNSKGVLAKVDIAIHRVGIRSKHTEILEDTC